MFKKRIIAVAILSGLGIVMAQAEIIAPIFSGKFYMGANYLGPDNCALSQFAYEYSGEFPNQLNLLAYLKNHYPQPGCSWTVTGSNTDVQAKPSDFPGNYTQWDTARAQFPSGIDYTFQAACITQTHTIQTTETVEVYPRYICHAPESRYGIDSQSHTEGCTTTPRLCLGDVVGRDLDVPGLHSAGHVGLTYPDGSVIQVMSKINIEDDPLITAVSFNDFKVASPYWGDKYGLFGSPYISMEEGQGMERAVFAQSSLAGSYEFDPIFVPLDDAATQVYDQNTKTWQEQVTSSYPMFRCDTFVDWIYYKSLKQMAVPFHEIEPVNGYKAYQYDHELDDPKTLYDALLNIRYNGLDAGHLAAPTPLKENSQNLTIADSTTYLTNPHINREVKIQKYWQDYNGSDPFKKNLAYGSLMLLVPTNLIPIFIERFNAEPQNQGAYLNLIIAGMQAQPQDINSDDLSNIVLGQEFLAAQVQNQSNPNLLAKAIYGYNSFTPYSPQKAALINAGINRLAGTKQIDPRMLLTDQFMLNINDPSGNSLNHLIGEMKEPQDQAQLNQLLISQTQNGLNASMLTQPNQSEIEGYLLQQIQRIQSPSPLSKSKGANLNDMSEIQNYDLIKAYGVFTNKPDFVSNTILSTTNRNLQASLIMAVFSDPWANHAQTILQGHKHNLIHSLTQGQDSNPNALLSTQETTLPLEIQGAVNVLNK